MTDDTQSRVYTTLNADELTPGEALQQLYSYTESTGPDVGGVIEDLQASDADTTHLVERITANSESFTAPQEGSDKHFTDIVGEAREAADDGDATTAQTLLDDVIVDLLEETSSVFESVQEEADDTDGISDTTVDEIVAVTAAYEHMTRLAETARTALK